MLNPIHLRTLRECVRTGSFAEAGRVLGYTSSAVSQQMVLLERALGASLFERTARSIRCTPLAERLAQRSKEVLGELEAIEREMRSVAVGETGSLRLAGFATANARLLPDVLAAVVAERPNARVQLDEGEPDEVIGEVLDGNVDAAVVFEYDLDPRSWPAELRVEELLAEPLRLCLPAKHPLAGREAVRLDELAADSWTCTRDDTAGARVLVRLAAAAGFVPNIVFRSNDYKVIRDLVARGLGPALLPAMAVGDEDVGVKPIAGRQPHRRVQVIYRQHNTNPLLPLALERLAKSCAALAERWAAPG
ncbi:DNA-binding transcriptional regulator, LysR family [Actinopolyspora lacussalsi subsp. righensis]|uniref:DNA-binding transcriptional regulator, LysR family n=1 Tax=Actinopolyspora righensis TaxID=995060 RepID=A0A1I7BF66_9ACTN|nr:LysR family transcriptional regulator [Actinopolyspora righensis]SFT85805.1 DNA-binding transcriptional regulator, LysR family [Actinopolyspora righensis]